MTADLGLGFKRIRAKEQGIYTGVRKLNRLVSAAFGNDPFPLGATRTQSRRVSITATTLHDFNSTGNDPFSTSAARTQVTAPIDCDPWPTTAVRSQNCIQVECDPFPLTATRSQHSKFHPVRHALGTLGAARSRWVRPVPNLIYTYYTSINSSH